MKFFLVVLVVLVGFIAFVKSKSSSFVNLNKTGKLFYDRFKTRFNNSQKGKQLPGADAVYVISMPQRKQYITAQINLLGINAIYFDAITPGDLSEEDYSYTSVNKPWSRIYKKYTRFAVLLSFLMCFMDALDKGHHTIVIFEDDITSIVTLETLTQSILEFNASELDVFYMGYCFLNCGQRVINDNYRYLVKLTKPDLLCCHSICIKTSILPGLIDFCFPMTTNSDELFRDYYVKNNVNVCVPKNIYFTQNRNEVDSLNESVDDDILFQTCKF